MVSISPLLHFDFQQEHCPDNVCQNLGSLNWSSSSSSSFIRNVSATKFSTGSVGIENLLNRLGTPATIPNATSHHLIASIEPVLAYLQEEKALVQPLMREIGDMKNKGISISLWLRSFPVENGNESRNAFGDQGIEDKTPVLTIGAAQPFPYQYAFTECDERQVDLQLTLENQQDTDHPQLSMLFRTSDNFFEPCQKLKIRNLNLSSSLVPNQLNHVMLVLGDRHQQIFINGQASRLMKEPFNNNLDHWNRTGVMELFSHRNMRSWSGQIYQLQFFPGIFSQDDVQSVMSENSPHAKPMLAQDMNLRMNEDAEDAAESHTKNWYLHPNDMLMNGTITKSGPQLKLNISFFDEEVDALLENAGIVHTHAPKVWIYIIDPPKNGALFYLDGSPIHLIGNFVPVKSRLMYFVPVHNAHSQFPDSIFTSITFCVALHDIVTPSQCLSSANVSVVVDAVNDPPIAILASEEPYVVHEGLVEESIPMLLMGSDVDREDKIATIEITSPPQLGYLYLSAPTRRRDNLFHGTPLAHMSFNIPGPEAFVEYRFDETSTSSLVRDSVVVDSFDFRVQDTHGSWSLPKTVYLQIVSSLVGIVEKNITSTTLKQDKVTSVALRSFDKSGLNRTIGYFMEEVSDIMITGGEQHDSMAANDILRESASTYVGIHPGAQLCEGRIDTSIAFRYRVVAYGKHGNITSASDPVEQNLQVLCKLKPLKLDLTERNITLPVLHGQRNDRCSGYKYHDVLTQPNISCPSLLHLDSIHLRSDASHTERVRVDIHATAGLLTLANQDRQHLRLLQDQAVMRSSIQFYASPEEINGIFARTIFQGEAEGIAEILVSVRYGQCTSTASNLQSRNDSNVDVAFHCTTAKATIRVNVLTEETSLEESEILFNAFSWIPLPFTLTIILLVKLKGKLRILFLSSKNGSSNSIFPILSDDTSTTVANTIDIRWQQFYDSTTGFYFYLDLYDESVTWDPPLNEDFIPCQERDGINVDNETSTSSCTSN